MTSSSDSNRLRASDFISAQTNENCGADDDGEYSLIDRK